MWLDWCKLNLTPIIPHQSIVSTAFAVFVVTR
ncbi:hypothetical protein [Klebsiella phage vB_KpnS-VAC112]|uniref:Uncharacterized protein n=3 Tax=Webervirus TaxID=1920860 RepID=A0A9E7NDG9_9CAUD|nr:hypothetical protein [Klebsiella phage vB_Kpn-VAC111]UEW68294.1 hypothetical protein [Klebsiella phage vB_KpnS-VAC112]UTN90194.1 hypothetical protein [Klebsiella phage vB_KpnS-VAC111]